MPIYYLLSFQILTTNLQDVECSCNSNLNVIMTEKGSTFQWIFTLTTSTHKRLKNVCLLSETGVQQQFKIGEFCPQEGACEIPVPNMASK